MSYFNMNKDIINSKSKEKNIILKNLIYYFQYFTFSKIRFKQNLFFNMMKKILIYKYFSKKRKFYLDEINITPIPQQRSFLMVKEKYQEI